MLSDNLEGILILGFFLIALVVILILMVAYSIKQLNSKDNGNANLDENFPDFSWTNNPIPKTKKEEKK